MNHPTKLSTAELRWECDGNKFEFETTAQVDPAKEIVGQQAAQEALMFGLECLAPGQNVYVRGARGTGRLTMVRKLLAELAPTTDAKKDRCYVHNFVRLDRPRLITLDAGTATAFRKQVGKLADFIVDDLPKALESEPYLSARNRLHEELQDQIKTITSPLENDLSENAMALVQIPQGQVNKTVIFPLVEGQPVPPDQLHSMVNQKKVPAEVFENFEKNYPAFQKRLTDIHRQISEKIQAIQKVVQDLNENAARELIEGIALPIAEAFKGQGVSEFINEVVKDAVENRMQPSESPENLKELYGVNVVLEHQDKTARPVVEEFTPGLINLLGTVEPVFRPGQPQASTDYRGIRAGALLAADQGYLILDAADLVAEPGAWRSMMRILRTGLLEIVPPEFGFMQPQLVVQPEPIEIKVRVILIGDAQTYFSLDHFDSDFSDLFKVLADFDDQLERTDAGAFQYAAVVANLCNTENLPHFDRHAVAEITEHGARIGGRANKLTSRFGRIADIAREAAFIASRENRDIVEKDDVLSAIQRNKKRASLPSRRFQEMISSKSITIETSGAAVGQINGLAVMKSGPLTYGFPARISATIGPGRSGLINIEGRANMSGSIHTKGFHILGGLLRTLLKTTHPMAFSASIAFEQSYGGIDGDSASGAEMVCLLSALTDIPVHQNMSMTGAIDQHGRIQAIGGVNEKIEGFFDACAHFGLTGDQGVVIPKSNAAELMLRIDVVEACKAGKFHVYAVDRIEQAIEVMMGVDAGEFNDGYPQETVLGQANKKAFEFWSRTLSSPTQLTSVVGDDDEPTGEPV